MPMQASILVN